MPRREVIIQVFVASPSDVQAERDALDQVVIELNRTWSQSLGVRLELLGWDTSMRGGIDSDLQAVINRQTPEEFDVFLGIFWARVGTPTPRSISGTVEEYERALTRYRALGVPEVLIYFKDSAIPPSRIDANQLGQLLQFKARLSTDGVLYHQFNDLGALEGLLRMHLARFVQESIAEHPDARAPYSAPPPSTRSEQPTSVDAFDDDEPGYLDLVEEVQEGFTSLSAVTERIGAATEVLGTAFGARTDALAALRESGRDSDVRTFKRIANGAAEDLDQFAAQLRLEIPVFGSRYHQSMTAFGKAIALAPEMGWDSQQNDMGTSLDELAGMAGALIASILGSRGHVESFRDTTSSMPRMTTAFNRARRKAVDAMNELMREMDSAAQLTSEVETSIRAMADAYPGQQPVEGIVGERE